MTFKLKSKNVQRGNLSNCRIIRLVTNLNSFLTNLNSFWIQLKASFSVAMRYHRYCSPWSYPTSVDSATDHVGSPGALRSVVSPAIFWCCRTSSTVPAMKSYNWPKSIKTVCSMSPRNTTLLWLWVKVLYIF